MRLYHILFMFIVIFFVNAVALYRFLDAYVWFVSAIIALLYPLGALAEEKYASKFTSWLYRLGAAWFESITILVLLVFLGFVIELLGISFAELDFTIFLIWVVLVGLGVLYARTWKITEIIVPTSKVTRKTSLVQLTDIHAFGAYAKHWVADAINRAKQLKPDVIVMTGDIVDVPSKPTYDVLSVTSDTPILYTLGNHEYYVGRSEVTKRVRKSPIYLLENCSRIVKGINFVGISDSNDPGVLKNISKFIKKSKYNILLFHRPQGMIHAAKSGIDLMLSGHTHGGVHFPLHLFVAAVYGRYYRGLHKIKNMILYTSNGSGTYNWPLRLFTPQEIVKITLVPK